MKKDRDEAKQEAKVAYKRPVQLAMLGQGRRTT